MCRFFNSYEESLCVYVFMNVYKLAKYVRNCVVFWKIYTADTLTRSPVATVATNSKSACCDRVCVRQGPARVTQSFPIQIVFHSFMTQQIQVHENFKTIICITSSQFLNNLTFQKKVQLVIQRSVDKHHESQSEIARFIKVR